MTILIHRNSMESQSLAQFPSGHTI